jgi:hypothetical protein
VFIHHAADDARTAALAARLAEYLRHEGFAVAAIRPVAFKIKAGSVRYFFESDRDGARRLLRVAGRQLAEGGRAEPRVVTNFSHYARKPRTGTVELWLPNS